MKTVAFFFVFLATLTASADVRSLAAEAQENQLAEQYLSDSNEYNLKMAQIYKNLAFTAAEARVQKNLMCEEGTYMSDIVSYVISAVTKAAYVNETEGANMIAEITANADVVTVAKQNYSYREVTLYPLHYVASDVPAVQKIIVGTKFWNPGMGAYGSSASVEFTSATEAEMGTMELLENEPYTQWSYKTVKYNVESTPEGAIVLVLDGQRFIMQKDWAWYNNGYYIIYPEGQQPNEEGSQVPAYLEYTSECEA